VLELDNGDAFAVVGKKSLVRDDSSRTPGRKRERKTVTIMAAVPLRAKRSNFYFSTAASR
jgi:hypothetical protein